MVVNLGKEFEKIIKINSEKEELLINEILVKEFENVVVVTIIIVVLLLLLLLL